MLVAIYHLQDLERARARRLIIRDQTIVVGRDPSCTIVIDDDPGVEPKHARFLIRAVDFVVDSLGGAILVNGTPITGATSCRPGDSIQLGDTVVKLRPESAVVVTQARPATEPQRAGASVRPDHDDPDPPRTTPQPAPFKPPIGPTGVLAPGNPPPPVMPHGNPPRPQHLIEHDRPAKVLRSLLAA